MANELHVVRVVTVTGITFEFYFYTFSDAKKITDKIKKRLKELEGKLEGKAPSIMLVDIEDDFGIRQVLDAKGIAGLIHTNTTASAKTAEAVKLANQLAKSAPATGFQSASSVVVTQ